MENCRVIRLIEFDFTVVKDQTPIVRMSSHSLQSISHHKHVSKAASFCDSVQRDVVGGGKEKNILRNKETPATAVHSSPAIRHG